jgi:hemerythrin-like domain-containing protein
MLNQITPTPSKSKTGDVVDLLIGCHQRIRHFTAIALKLAHALGATSDEIRQAAEAVYRYYSVSLPLHEADEDESLRPRLQPLADEKIQHALLAMSDQHQTIDEILERLLPLLMLLKNNPNALGEVSGEICGITKTLEEVFRGHLQMEEEVIFPAIRTALSGSAREEVWAEMQKRRTQG